MKKAKEKNVGDGRNPPVPHCCGITVIGAGYWGKSLVRDYHQLKVLKLICDKNEMTLAQFNRINPNVEVSLSLQEAFLRTDVQDVAIATPAETHYSDPA